MFSCAHLSVLSCFLFTLFLMLMIQRLLNYLVLF